MRVNWCDVSGWSCPARRVAWSALSLGWPCIDQELTWRRRYLNRLHMARPGQRSDHGTRPFSPHSKRLTNTLRDYRRFRLSRAHAAHIRLHPPPNAPITTQLNGHWISFEISAPHTPSVRLTPITHHQRETLRPTNSAAPVNNNNTDDIIASLITISRLRHFPPARRVPGAMPLRVFLRKGMRSDHRAGGSSLHAFPRRTA